ncbi:hypothetical protein [Actinoplanes sp. NBRC 103695]|uniref:hypothetical protein n=1 Tax=Actinoplanes sp. NBRC 103695 TaxID=3032202 RepID=UPI00249FC6D3|nr:hypothetical protein [Actinoplanes sp. NBRC 103695]GLY96680.1 hypothetical protein Acsp02_39350 [Actinoplanes sp. NBRC 103695]
MRSLRTVLIGAASAAVLVLTTAQPASATFPWLRLELRYTGELQAPALVRDSSGNEVHGAVLTGGGGTVTPVTENGRQFLRFPGGSCTTAPCPQGIIRPTSTVTLVPGNEGEGRFVYGADIRLTAPPSPDAGQNVFQFGAAGAGLSQWKLQVDYGRPSCRWSDGTQVVLLPAGPEGWQMTVGRWYRVTCSRKARVFFSTRVEDPATGRPLALPRIQTVQMAGILPTGNVVIGGKRINAAQSDVDTDQFHGDLDNVEFGRRSD